MRETQKCPRRKDTVTLTKPLTDEVRPPKKGQKRGSSRGSVIIIKTSAPEASTGDQLHGAGGGLCRARLVFAAHFQVIEGAIHRILNYQVVQRAMASRVVEVLGKR